MSTHVIALNRRNLYEFGPEALDGRDVKLVLEEMPETIGERLHAFSLFHKASRLRRPRDAAYHHDRIAEALSRPERVDLPVTDAPLRARLHDAALLADRALTKCDGWRRWNGIKSAVDAAVRPAAHPARGVRHALITGWYGAETAGDKAILLEVVHAIRQQYPGARISLTSIVPGHSRLTNIEMGLDAELIELRRPRFHALATVDLVVFGGGPIMDSSQLRHIATLFGWAKRRGIPAVIFGCGVGPLKTASGEEHARKILSSADAGFFRDERSAVEAVRLGYRGEPLHACDPALAFVDRWRRAQVATGSGRGIVTLLRAQTSEYSRSAAAEAERVASTFATIASRMIADRAGTTIDLLAMHSFWLGNDDREYNAKIAAKAATTPQLRAHPETLTLDELLAAIASAGAGVPMRFHGHLFLIALHIPFVSVDYTGRAGKVSSLLDRYGLREFSLPSDEHFSADAFLEKWKAMEQSRDRIVSAMRSQLDADVASLHRAYEQVWAKVA